MQKAIFLLLSFFLFALHVEAQKGKKLDWRNPPKNWKPAKQATPMNADGTLDMDSLDKRGFQLAAVPQKWEHIYDSVRLTAKHVGSGSVFQLMLYDTPPEDIIFPLPTGVYDIQMGTDMNPKYMGSYYLDFDALMPNVVVQQGTHIEVPSTAANQALIMIDTIFLKNAPVIYVNATPPPPTDTTGYIGQPPLYSAEPGQAYTMSESQGYYYKYVKPGLSWNIGEYVFVPNAGEVWNFNMVKISYDDTKMFTDSVRWTPPIMSLIEAEAFAAQGGTMNDASTGKPGVIIASGPQGGIVTFFNTGDWLRYDSVDLQGQDEIVIRYSYGLTDTQPVLEVRADDITGPLLGSSPAIPTGGWNIFKDLRIILAVSTRSNVNLYLVVKGPNSAQSYWGNIDKFVIGGELPPPISKIEAEAFTEWYNLRYSAAAILPLPAKGVGGVTMTSWIKYSAVNLTNRTKITFQRSGVFDGKKMEIRITTKEGQKIGDFVSVKTTAWSDFKPFDVPITPITGVYDLFFVFKDDAVMDWDWFELK